MNKKRRRRRRKFNNSFGSKEVEMVETFERKVTSPLKSEWDAYLYSTTPTTSTERLEEDFHHKQNPSPGIIKNMISKYCSFESSIGILQLCDSKLLSKQRQNEMFDDRLKKVAVNKESSSSKIFKIVRSAFMNLFS